MFGKLKISVATKLVILSQAYAAGTGSNIELLKLVLNIEVDYRLTILIRVLWNNYNVLMRMHRRKNNEKYDIAGYDIVITVYDKHFKLVFS